MAITINNFSIIDNGSKLAIDVETDIYFIEVESDAPTEECPTCLLPALGITYNLLPYYACMLDYLLKSEITDCSTCNNLTTKNSVVTINLLIDSVEKSIELGFYLQAISSINKLKKLCELKQCKTCKQVECNSCGKFNQAT